ncbi:uncharacterized protein [Amphiura filiformis]|uniref:uncharacterized protein n=1 Tax=Amphiura filiformis TaxID=82378 RepID=UPI003B21DE03
MAQSRLNDTIVDGELTFPGYTTYRKDRLFTNKSRGGGVLFFVRSNLISLRRSELEPQEELVVIDIRPRKSQKMAVVLCYRPPDGDVSSFSSALFQTLTTISKEYNIIHLIGDFNVPKLQGCFSDSIPQSVPVPEQDFMDTINSFNLTQMNTHPSRKKCDNILDLIFSTTHYQISDISISSEFFQTDHVLLEFVVYTKINRLRPATRFVYNFKNANFSAIRSELTSTDFSRVYNASNVDMSWNNFTDIFMNIINKHISKVKDCTAPVWIDSEIRHLRNKKESAWRRAKKPDSPQAWESFLKLRNRLKNLIQDKYNDYIDSLGATISDNPKRFWSYFKSKTQSCTLPQVIKGDQCTASEASDKAQLFNSYFYSVFSKPRDDNELPDIPMFQHQLLGSIQIEESDVLEILCSLDTSKAAGPDGISPRLLKECASQIAHPLCHIFNCSLSSGKLPSIWLKANVVPVYKKGDK